MTISGTSNSVKYILLASIILGGCILSGCGSKEPEGDPKALDKGLNGMDPTPKSKNGGPVEAGK